MQDEMHRSFSMLSVKWKFEVIAAEKRSYRFGETSVVFAVLIGRMFPGEALSARRIFACLIVAAGAILLGL